MAFFDVEESGEFDTVNLEMLWRCMFQVIGWQKFSRN